MNDCERARAPESQLRRHDHDFLTSNKRLRYPPNADVLFGVFLAFLFCCAMEGHLCILSLFCATAWIEVGDGLPISIHSLVAAFFVCVYMRLEATCVYYRFLCDRMN